MDRVLVTGGSGFVGRRLLTHLHRIHPELELHNLDVVPSGLPVVEHLSPVEVEETYSSLPPMDAVVHLAAVSREPGFPTSRYYEVNTWGTAALGDWALAAGVRKVIFYSSIAVYGPAEEPTNEHSQMCPETPYGMSKLLGEQELRLRLGRAGTSLVVIRPGVVFGPGDDGNFARLARAVQQGWFVFPGRTDTRKAAIYVDDLVDFTGWLLGYDCGESLTVNAVYDRAATVDEIVGHIGAAVGRRTRRVVVPEGLARVGVGVLGLAEAYKPPVKRMFHQRRVDKLLSSTNIVSDVLPQLPYTFPHSPAEAVGAWLSSGADGETAPEDIAVS